MNVKRFIKEKLISKLPNKFKLDLERLYLYYYHGDDYLGTDIRIFRRLSIPDKNAIDIGANNGDVTLFLCKLSRHVYCFEPLPALCEDLREKFHSSNVTIENCALGHVNDDMYLNVPAVGNRKYTTRSSLITDFKNDYIMGEKATDIEKIKVKIKRLDDFAISNVGFIKIDVEGFELHVLKGAEKTIKQNMPNMYIEIEQRHHHTDNIHNIFQYILELDYFGYFLNNKKLTKIEEFDVQSMQVEQDEESSSYINNFIFTPIEINDFKV